MPIWFYTLVSMYFQKACRSCLYYIRKKISTHTHTHGILTGWVVPRSMREARLKKYSSRTQQNRIQNSMQAGQVGQTSANLWKDLRDAKNNICKLYGWRDKTCSDGPYGMPMATEYITTVNSNVLQYIQCTLQLHNDWCFLKLLYSKHSNICTVACF